MRFSSFCLSKNLLYQSKNYVVVIHGVPNWPSILLNRRELFAKSAFVSPLFNEKESHLTATTATCPIIYAAFEPIVF